MSEISPKIAQIEIKLYRNPRGSENLFYSDQLDIHINGLKQYKKYWEKIN